MIFLLKTNKTPAVLSVFLGITLPLSVNNALAQGLSNKADGLPFKAFYKFTF